ASSLPWKIPSEVLRVHSSPLPDISRQKNGLRSRSAAPNFRGPIPLRIGGFSLVLPGKSAEAARRGPWPRGERSKATLLAPAIGILSSCSGSGQRPTAILPLPASDLSHLPS